MDPITIGLAIAGAKKLLETATDIKDIAGSIEELFNHTEKTAQATEQGDGDASISSVVTDVITEKNNKIKLLNLEIDIDNKFGFGTWAAIKDERERRLNILEDNKAKAAKARKEKQKADKAFYDKCIYWLGEFGKLLAIIALAGGAGYVIWINRCVDGTC
tara:strand:+ start:402 stop:881 length:480 start_codon:yes stop_codon:yes gene_type:complete